MTNACTPTTQTLKQGTKIGSWRASDVEVYVIATCQGRKTLDIAKLLAEKSCWAPILKRKNPTKKQKHIVAALPGFLFIEKSQWEAAFKMQEDGTVPKFSPLIINGTHAYATLHELTQLSKAVSSVSLDAEELGAMRVGDFASVQFGPLLGLEGTIEEIYIDTVPMVLLRIRANQTVNLPLKLIRVRR